MINSGRQHLQYDDPSNVINYLNYFYILKEAFAKAGVITSHLS